MFIKLRKKKSFNFAFKKTRIIQHQHLRQVKAGKNVYLFVLISLFVSYGVCFYIQYFLDAVRNKLQTKNIY